MVDAMAKLFAAAEHHGGGGTQSQGMGHAVHFFPVIARTLQARNFRANFIVKNFRAASGNGLQPRIHQALNRFANADFADFRDAQNFGRRKTVQMDLRIACFQGAQQIFVIANLQVRVQAALEQNASAAKFQHFVNFLVNFLERKDVAILGAERAVKRAEGTILGAEIRVIDVAVDLVSDDARIVFLQAHFVRGHADADEVIGFEQFESLLFRQCHDDSLFCFRINCNQRIALTRIYDPALSARLRRRALEIQCHGFRSGPFERLGSRDQAEFCRVGEV